MIELLQFFFQDFFHWFGGLIYMGAAVGVFGIALGLVAEMFRGNK